MFGIPKTYLIAAVTAVLATIDALNMQGVISFAVPGYVYALLTAAGLTTGRQATARIGG